MAPIVDKLNKFVAPLAKLFQHGANDDYWVALKGEVKLGNALVGEKFVVAMPDGRVEVMDLDALRVLYRKMSIPWPLDN